MIKSNLLLLTSLLSLHFNAFGFESRGTIYYDGHYVGVTSFNLKSDLEPEILVKELFLNIKTVKQDNPLNESLSYSESGDRIFMETQAVKFNMKATLKLSCNTQKEKNFYSLSCNFVSMKSVVGSSIKYASVISSCKRAEATNDYLCKVEKKGQTSRINLLVIKREPRRLALGGLNESLHSEISAYSRLSSQQEGQLNLLFQKQWDDTVDKVDELNNDEKLNYILNDKESLVWVNSAR